MHSGAAALRPLINLLNGTWKQSYLLILIALAALAALLSMQIFRGSVLYETWVQDVFIHLNGVLNIQAGNLPHRDFSTPLGAFYYFAHYLATAFGPPSAFTAVYANGLVAGLAAILTLLTGYRRLNAGWIAILTLYVGVIAMSPRQLGHLFITFNASYNRWSWALMAVLAVLVSLPRRDADSPRAAVLDGILSATLLGFLFFTKATFAVVGLGLLLASAATVRRKSHPWLYVLTTGALLTLTILSVELSLGLVTPYISDLQRAAQVPGVSRVQQLVTISYLTSSDAILIAMIATAAWAGSRPRLSLHPVIYLVILIGAGLAIATQNHLATEVPLTPIAALIALQIFQASISERIDILRAAAAAAVLILFLRAMALDSAAIMEESFAPASAGHDVDWLDNTPLKDLAFRAAKNIPPAGSQCVVEPEAFGTGREFILVVQDGVRLLHKHKTGRGRVLSFTWSNPFPLIFGTTPPRQDLAWWDPGRTFTYAVHPPAESLFRDVDYLMIPKYQGSNAPTAKFMLEIYAAEIQRKYRPLGESGCWRLLGAARRS